MFGFHVDTLLCLLFILLIPLSSCLFLHLSYFPVASSQANNQLINQLGPWIIAAAPRGALRKPSRL